VRAYRADTLGKYVPMLTTAAGTTKAANVLVLGVAVAGLQAMSTMDRLGAEVFAYDIRPETKDQAQSLGATFIDSDDEGRRSRGRRRVRGRPQRLCQADVVSRFYAFAEPSRDEYIVEGEEDDLMMRRKTKGGPRRSSMRTRS
jgi:NAD(P) transhydrogenase subunit alpha